VKESGIFSGKVSVSLLGLLPGDDHCEGARARPPFAFPVFGTRIQALQHVESLGGEPEVAQAVAVVADQHQQIERLGRRLHAQVLLPRQMRLAIHYIWENATHTTRYTDRTNSWARSFYTESVQVALSTP